MHSRTRSRKDLWLVLASTVALATCTDHTAPELDTDGRYITPTGRVTANPPAIFVGAGDIGSCSKTGDSQTAALLDAVPEGRVFVLGDNVYPNGTTSEYANCYDPTWGRHKARTYPSAGNHDYNTPGAAPYYAYFGAAAGAAGQGYYSFNYGAWHVVVLNSNISRTSTSPQGQWLQADLAANSNVCTLAYFHHPLYSSTGGSGTGGAIYKSVRPFWDELYAAGADLVLNGHRHVYERLAPTRPDGTRDTDFGVRAIVVGSGGIGGGTLTNLHPASEVRNGSTRGVLKLYLYQDSYAWKFIPVAGKTFSDSGSTLCHGAPAAGGGGVSPSRSTVSASPATVTASAGSSTASVTVTANDANGKPVAGAAVVISATGSSNLITQPAGATNANGIATGTLSSSVAEAKTISAKVGGITVSQTAAVTVSPGAAAALAFTTQPGNASSGSALSPPVQVEIRDQFGNRVTGATQAVTVSLASNPAGGTLAGTTTVNATGGVASFSTLSVDRAGTGYALAASAQGLTGATSSTFDVTAAPGPVSPSQSSLSAAPATIATSSGSSAATITVTARDANGTPLAGLPVTLSATGSGNTLTQPAGSTNASGVATGALSSTAEGTKTVSAIVDGISLTQSATVTVTAASPGGIVHTLLTSGNHVVNQKVYTTAAISPAAGALVTVAVLSHRSNGAIGPTLSGGGMAAWIEVGSVDFDAVTLPRKRLTVFRAMSASPGTGPITITYPSNVSNTQWVVSQWSGVRTGGSDGSTAIAQTGSDRGDAVSGLSVTLAPFASGGNVAYGVFGVSSKTPTITPGSGFSEIAEQASGESPAASLQAEWAIDRPTVGAGWANLMGSALAMEIKAVSSP